MSQFSQNKRIINRETHIYPLLPSHFSLSDISPPILDAPCTLRLFLLIMPPECRVLTNHSTPDGGAECLFLCSVREHISRTAASILTKFLAYVTYGRGSVLLWRRCDTLCTSAIYAHNGPYCAYRAIPLRLVTSVRRRAQASAAAAWYWLRRVVTTRAPS